MKRMVGYRGTPQIVQPAGRWRTGAFTLVELLVVISVVGGLMAVLVPTTQRVRRQARAVVCQSQLRQWGIAFTVDDEPVSILDRFQPFLRAYTDYDRMEDNALRTGAREVYLCSSASKIGRPVPSLGPEYLHLEAWDGSKSRAWAYRFMGRVFASSYTVNLMREYTPVRKTLSEARPSEVPILFDSTFRLSGLIEEDDPPPQYDDRPRDIPTDKSTRACSVCIDRHDGGINVLFMDASVRKVGLKELWTLGWNAGFDRTGPWTRAGGVETHDWPEWMWRFKDD